MYILIDLSCLHFIVKRLLLDVHLSVKMRTIRVEGHSQREYLVENAGRNLDLM